MLAENSSELFSDGVNDQDKRLNKIPSLENRENSIYMYCTCDKGTAVMY